MYKFTLCYFYGVIFYEIKKKKTEKNGLKIKMIIFISTFASMNFM